MKTWILPFLGLCFCGSILASGTSGTSGTTATPAEGRPAFQAAKTMKCVVRQVAAPDLIQLLDLKTGEETVFKFAKKVRLRARHKNAFDGRKKLTFADLAAGQEVKIAFRPHTGEIFSLKVLSIPDNAPSS